MYVSERSFNYGFLKSEDLDLFSITETVISAGIINDIAAP